MSRFYAAHGFRAASFYLALPIGALLLSRDELGRFFYYLAIVHVIASVSTFGLNSYLLRKSYNCVLVDLIFWRATGLIIMTYGVLIVIIGVWSTGPILILLISAMRALSTVSEARLMALKARNLVSSIYVAYGIVFVLAAVIGGTLIGDHRSFLVAIGVAEGAIFIGALVWRPCTGSILLYFRHMRNRKSWCIEGRGITYGLPMLLAGVFNLSLNLADRLVIEYFGTFSDVAMFSMMYSLAVASNRFITQPANLRLTSTYLGGQASQSSISTARSEGSVVLIMVTGWAVASTLGGNIVLGLIGSEYVVSSANYLLIGSSAIAMTAFTLSSMHIKRSKSPWALVPLLGFAAICNLVLSVLLVPALGFLGASFSTFVAYWLLYFVAGVSSGRSGVVDERVLFLCMSVMLLLAISLLI